ncbi:MHYT domain-containing protein [Paenibacillus ehimensis]|nr:MHYT domain-containing protein [Paenibacillus ehimensis]
MQHLHGTYSIPLVLLSVFISICSSYCALDLSERMPKLCGRSKSLWMVIGSVIMGLGIWSMHFIGMLALHLPVDVRYHSHYMVLSILLPIGAAWAALSAISGDAPARRQSLAGFLWMGLAIAGMHYTGMAAMQIPGIITYDPYWVGLSLFIAFGISFVAFRWASVYRTTREGRPSSFWAKCTTAALLGFAMAGMHYSGMVAANFQADGAWMHDAGEDLQGLDDMLLASWIGAAALIVLLLLAFSQFLERRFAQRLADVNKQRYDSVFEHNPDMVCLFDLSGRVLQANPAAERISGYSREHFVGQPFTRFMNRQDSMKIRACFARVLEGTPQTVECSIRRRDGRTVHLSTTIVPMKEDGKIVDIYTISKDITEQKKTERQLIEAKLEAERAARVKSEFLAVMSHEVRTPLNGVIGMSELLLETDLNEDQREYVKIIGKSGKALLSVINDVLDFSKIESGKMKLKNEPFHLAECLQETLRLFTPQLQHRALELHVHSDSGVPEFLIGDEVRLRQVLINLIGNAVKFTEQGGIEVRIRQVYRRGEQLELEFTVRDTGIGIPKKAIPYLFQPFYQLDSTARKHGGTGLGLAICKKLVELMGGSIRAESSPGNGAVFVFTIQVRCIEDKMAVRL